MYRLFYLPEIQAELNRLEPKIEAKLVEKLANEIVVDKKYIQQELQRLVEEIKASDRPDYKAIVRAFELVAKTEGLLSDKISANISVSKIGQIIEELDEDG
jgi:archaellum component FlaC